MKTLSQVATVAGTTDHVPTITHQQLRTVVRLSRERLGTANAVAEAKFLTGQPVADLAREHVVLQKGTRHARSRGIDPIAIRRALCAQIEANKYVQRALLDKWRAHPESAPTVHPDLVSDVRPALDRVDQELVTAIGAAAAVLSAPTSSAAVRRIALQEEAELDPLHRQALTIAINGLRR